MAKKDRAGTLILDEYMKPKSVRNILNLMNRCMKSFARLAMKKKRFR